MLCYYNYLCSVYFAFCCEVSGTADGVSCIPRPDATSPEYCGGDACCLSNECCRWPTSPGPGPGLYEMEQNFYVGEISDWSQLYDSAGITCENALREPIAVRTWQQEKH